MGKIRESKSDEAKRAVRLLDECKEFMPSEYYEAVESLVDVAYSTGIIDGALQSRKIFDHSFDGLRL